MINGDGNPSSDNPIPQRTAEEEEHVLPPRRNRGVPPKRYSLECESRASRYPVANLVRGSMLKEARAFMTDLYTKVVTCWKTQSRFGMIFGYGKVEPYR